MKSMKRVLALVLAMVMCLGLATVAMAAEIGDGNATINMVNTAKGDVYTLYKVFDATYNTNTKTVAYTVPDGIKAVFSAYLVNGNQLQVTDDNKAAIEALVQGLTADQLATLDSKEITSTGATTMTQSVPYGYYYFVKNGTPQGQISLSSASDVATVYDKNTYKPNQPNDGAKQVDKDNVSVGETVTYTVTFNTTNYEGAGQQAAQITEYTVTDTLPGFLGQVELESVTVVENPATDKKKENTIDIDDNTFADSKSITIPWTEDGVSKYNNGAQLVVVYSAKVTSQATVGAENGNENTVTLSWKTVNGDSSKTVTDQENIYTYALAIQKVDGEGQNLAGAKFTIAGVTAVTGSAGNYKLADANNPDATTGLAELECDANGYLVVEGVAAEKAYTVTETVAPQGYNKLTEPTSVTPSKIKSTTATTTQTIKYGETGQIIEEGDATTTVIRTETNPTELKASQLLVINNAGSTLPSTGGIGTTIFYVIGGILVIGAGVLLVTKKRMSHNG